MVRKTQIHFYFLTAQTAQTTQTEEFMLQNWAYRPTVYRTGYKGCYLENSTLDFQWHSSLPKKNRSSDYAEFKTLTLVGF